MWLRCWARRRNQAERFHERDALSPLAAGLVFNGLMARLYVNHVELRAASTRAAMRSFLEEAFYATHGRLGQFFRPPCGRSGWLMKPGGIDWRGEVAVIVGDVQWAPYRRLPEAMKLVMLVNDVTARIIPASLARFGFFQGQTNLQPFRRNGHPEGKLGEAWRWRQMASARSKVD